MEQQQASEDSKDIERMAQLFAALAKAQAVMRGALKDSTNPHFKSKYADLKSIWDAIREPLTSNGLCVLQELTTKSGDPTQLIVCTTLGHVSGATRHSFCPVYAKDWGNAQAVGSAITYARRYALASLVGVVADDDDDGNHAARSPSLAEAVRANSYATSLPEEQKKQLWEYVQSRSVNTAVTFGRVDALINEWRANNG